MEILFAAILVQIAVALIGVHVAVDILAKIIEWIGTCFKQIEKCGEKSEQTPL